VRFGLRKLYYFDVFRVAIKRSVAPFANGDLSFQLEVGPRPHKTMLRSQELCQANTVRPRASEINTEVQSITNLMLRACASNRACALRQHHHVRWITRMLCPGHGGHDLSSRR
jgi:hypothetical protein